MKSGFRLSAMREIKEKELPVVHSLLTRCIVRTREVLPLIQPPGEVGIIAEIKKASPSLGVIRDVLPLIQSRIYREGGACAMSVLTDNSYFGGCWNDLRTVAGESDVPVLCKEFIFFEEQIDLAYSLNADMVLLIARALTDKRLDELYHHALSLSLLPVLEVHSPDELGPVLALQPDCLLVNSRNLETLAMDPDTALQTLKALPGGTRAVWASGIESAADVAAVRGKSDAGLFLVGSALMKSDNPGELIREMRNVR